MSQENVEVARRWIEEHKPPVPSEAFKPLEFIDAGGDAVVFVALVGGPAHPHRHGSVFRVRDGKVTDWKPYPSEKAAREAAGLRD
jgi:hypothetical protein